MDFERYLTAVAEQAAAFVDAARAAGPDAGVPSCPDWTVQQLAAHLAGVHRWAAECCRTPADDRMPKKPETPADFAALLDWTAEGAAALADTMRALGADRPCRVFRGASPEAVAFWARRQAHETAIHRLDAELARGPAAELLFDSELAADGVDELLAGMLPATARFRDAPGVRGTALFHAADAGRAWWVRVAGDGSLDVGDADVRPATGADVTVAGTADALYRAVWGRPSGAVVTGDARVLEPLAAP